MIIIQLAGGLGNQMFQYALYLQLKSLGKDVKIDDVSGFAEDQQRVPALAPFGIAYEKASHKEIEQMLDASPLLWHKVRRKLCGRNRKSYFEEDKLFKPEIFTWDDIYLEGYWQTEKYFESAAEQIKEAYDIDRLFSYVRSIQEANTRSLNAHGAAVDNGNVPDAAERNENTQGIVQDKNVQNRQNGQKKSANRILDDYIQEIESVESVSVHIRRGDYLTPENQALFGNICTKIYYRKAMEQMKEQHPGCRFYLFTNDKEWAGSIDNGEFAQDVTVIGLPEEAVRDYAEFILMSKCKHNILANSSFSWWASYLNRNPEKKVYVPDKWLNGWDCRDFYRADMQKIYCV